jgi:thiol-disulfide isomerase/thioredoxin
MRPILILSAILLVSGAVLAQTYDLESFQTRVGALDDDAAIAALCRDYLEHATDIDVQRRAEDAWSQVAPEAVRVYAGQKAADHPDSPRWAYLLGRVVEDKVEAVKLGRQEIAIDSTWPYGYRLVLAQYAADLLRASEPTPDSRRLAETWPEDEPLVDKLLALAPEEAFAWEFAMHARIYAHDYAGALQAVERGKGLNAPWADGTAMALAYAGLGRFDEAMTAIAEEADRRIRDWKWPEDYRHQMIVTYYTDALREAGAYRQAIDYLAPPDSQLQDAGTLYDVACLWALAGVPDSALHVLGQAIDRGWDKVRHTEEDLDLAALHDTPRWSDLVAACRKNWDGGRDARRRAALAKQIDREAPPWSLADADGHLVNLADLRGKIVVLDFWATWCGPCQMSMPMIDEFVRRHAGPDVAVYSVDVWEKGHVRQVTYMQKHDYAMKLLFGNDELASAYEVEGIPHLCVIDKSGHIRFAESGVTDELLENLIFWTEDLAGGS